MMATDNCLDDAVVAYVTAMLEVSGLIAESDEMFA